MSWLPVALLGGVVAADSTSFVQAMISRPIIAATLAGLLFGKPVEGLMVGMLLEAFSLVILPIGAARNPEAGTAAVAAGAAYAATAAQPVQAEMLAFAVLFGLIWERVGGTSVDMLRRLNERIVNVRLDSSRRPDRVLARRHLAALVLDFARGTVVVLTGYLIGRLALTAVAELEGAAVGLHPGVLVVTGTLMLAAALPLFGGWERQRLALTLGIASGLLLVWLRSPA